MPSYIDIHSHILHAIDDGPHTLTEAVDLARAYVSAGFGTVIATPHATDGRPAPVLIEERLAELRQELARQNILLTVLPGCEYHIESKTLERLHSGEILTLNHSRYLLLELPFFQPLPPYTLPLIDSLATAGYIPVIPHPERALDLQQNPYLFFDLLDAGALFQVTWGALTGKIGPVPRRVAFSLVEAGMAHFFATDAHSASGRLMKLEKSSAILTDLLGPEALEDLLVNRPRCLLENQPLDLPPAREPTADRGSLFHAPKATFISRLRRRIGC